MAPQKRKRRLIERLSIRNKLILLVLTVLVIVMIIAFTLIILRGVKDYKTNLANSTHLYAKVIGEYCIAPLAFSDNQGALEMLAKIKALPEIKTALLFDTSDSLIARYSIDSTHFPARFKPNHGQSGFQSDAFIAVEPIQYQKTNYGSIVLVASTHLLQKQIRDYITLVFLLLLFLILISYMLTSWLQGYISRPVLKLAEFTGLISREGNYSLRIQKEGDDEIGLLYDRFNEMLEQIRHRDQITHEAETLARLTNEELTLLLENVPLGFLHFDRLGVVTTCNKSHELIFDLKKEDLLGKNLHETIIDPEMKQSLEDALQGTRSVYTGLYTSTLSGKSIFIRALFTPLFDESQLITGGIGIFEDISEQKRMEKLQVEKEAALFANRAKSIFLANMSHEIRTPMNAILGFSQIMEKDPHLTEDQRENVSIINSSGEHLMALINNILEMSKIEAGRIQLNTTTFNLHALYDEVATLYRIKAEEKKLYLLFEPSADVPAYIMADEGKIRQIMSNLLNNAIKFTNEGGINIRLWSTKSEEGKILLHTDVEDTGTGIGEEELGKVFEHFEQTRSGKQLHTGTGLGLAICKEYVHMMNGEISVKSQLGKGSLFRFYIEVAMGDDQDAIQNQIRQNITGIAPGQRIPCILVVDDKEPNRKLLVKMLTGIGFRVISANDGLEAVEAYREQRPDLIMMDMFMPAMDGFEAIQKIRQLPGGSDTRIFAVTASVFEEDKSQILKSGANEFISKPFRESEILEKTAAHLNLRYTYEQAVAVKEQLKKTFTLTPEQVSTLPEELIKAIKEALIKGDLEMIEYHLLRIRDHNAAMADALIQLVKTFNLEKLNKLFRIL